MKNVFNNFLKDQWLSVFRLTNVASLMIYGFFIYCLLNGLTSDFANEKMMMFGKIMAVSCFILSVIFMIEYRTKAGKIIDESQLRGDVLEGWASELIKSLILLVVNVSLIIWLFGSFLPGNAVFWMIIASGALVNVMAISELRFFAEKFPWRLLRQGCNEKNYTKIDSALRYIRDINRLSPLRHENPLAIAMQFNDIGLVEHVMNKGADPMLAIHGITILQKAAFRHYDDAYGYMKNRLDSEKEMSILESLIDMDKVDGSAKLAF